MENKRIIYKGVALDEADQLLLATMAARLGMTSDTLLQQMVTTALKDLAARLTTDKLTPPNPHN